MAYHKFVLDLTLLLFVIADTNSQRCTEAEIPKNKGCPVGLVTTPPPLSCVHFTDTKDTWGTAHTSICPENKNSTLLQVYKTSWFDWFTTDLLNDREYWLGLINSEKDDVWKWTTSLVAHDFNWEPGEPSMPKKDRRCVRLSEEYDWKWADTECADSHYIACHYQHPLGPTRPTLQVNYHRPNQMYFGYKIVLTCSAFNSEGYDLEWTFSKNGKSTFVMPFVKSSTKQVLEKHPVYRSCAKKTISVFTFHATTTVKDLHVSCFSRRGGDKTVCSSKAHPLAMCSGLHLKFVSGPIKPPIANYIYDGAPGPVTINSIVKVKCTVFTGKVGRLTWVLGFESKRTVLEDNDDRIVSTHQDIHPEFGSTEFSILQFKMTSALIGMSVTCFAHKFSGMNLSCTANKFCVKLDPLPVESYSSGVIKLFLFLSPFIIFTAAITMRSVYKRRHYSLEGEYAGEEFSKHGSTTEDGRISKSSMFSKSTENRVDKATTASLGNEKDTSMSRTTVNTGNSSVDGSS